MEDLINLVRGVKHLFNTKGVKHLFNTKGVKHLFNTKGVKEVFHTSDQIDQVFHTLLQIQTRGVKMC